MTETVRIALDAMGGDHGPEVVVPGAAIALSRKPDMKLLFVGDESLIRPHLEADSRLKAASEILHTDVSVRMEDKPSVALRKGRWKSSMWLALDAVKTRRADAAVSAGNTGALMAMSRFCLRMMADVERPAIAAIWPTLRGESIVLDVGATIGADARQLVDFAVMGSAMARILFDIERPTVGLLNVGVEEIKGVEQVKEAARLLREEGFPALDFRGFVEGDDLGKGTVDVVVTEGFSGNIALKTAEGTARQIAEYLRAAMGRTLLSKIGYVLAKHAFDTLRDKMDPRKVNGGVFLGLDGVVIKSHGGTDAEGFASAVELGYDMVRYDLMEQIRKGLLHDQPAAQSAGASAAPTAAVAGAST
jgi:glycerol-3-phosphate acyltransferase PlsX